MDNKYKDIVRSLVENHRKYKDYEPIIDDILNDIYEKAEAVLNSVDDESVITMYLDKVVSTSMVTVPKRLNFNTRRSRTLEIIQRKEAEKVDEPTPEPEVKELQEVEPVIEEIDIEPAQEKVYLTENAEIEDNAELSEFNADVQEELEIEESVNSIDDLSGSEDILLESASDYEENILQENEEIITEDDSASIDKVDVTLVDKMINGITEDADEVENIELDDSYDNLDLLDTSVTADQQNIIFDDESVEEFETQLTDDNEDILTSQDDNEEKSVEFKLPSYSGFKTDIYVEEPDSEDVRCEITELDSMYPNKHILQICELKYKDNKSVEEIADILNLSEDDVIDVLDEISRAAVNC